MHLLFVFNPDFAVSPITALRGTANGYYEAKEMLQSIPPLNGANVAEIYDTEKNEVYTLVYSRVYLEWLFESVSVVSGRIANG